jgi:uncharacterized RDD family membrane protein YckC
MALFNTIKILTPESVELEFTLAGIGSRAVALVVDYMVLGLALTLLLSVIYSFSTRPTGCQRCRFYPYPNRCTLQMWITAIFALLMPSPSISVIL